MGTNEKIKKVALKKKDATDPMAAKRQALDAAMEKNRESLRTWCNHEAW